MRLTEQFKAWFRRNISDADPYPHQLSNLDWADHVGIPESNPSERQERWPKSSLRGRLDT